MPPPSRSALTNVGPFFISLSWQRTIMQTKHDGDGATGWDDNDDDNGTMDDNVDDDCEGAADDEVRRDGRRRRC